MNNILLQTACSDIVSIENTCKNCKNVHILFSSDDNCIPTISAHLSNQNSCHVDLLVGLDFCHNFISGNVKRGHIGEPIA